MAKKPSEEKLAAQGARIREALDAAGKEQAAVAEQIGVKPHTLWRWLNGDHSAKSHFSALSIALGVSAEWLEHGDGPRRDDRADIIERFIEEDGPKMKPPLTAPEAAYLRATPHHKVTAGRLRDAIDEARYGFTREELRRSEQVTDAARARGAKLGVPKAKP